MSTPTIPAEKTRLTREEINRKQKEYVFPSVTTYYADPVPMQHAEMQHVWDVDGKQYLDFFGGIVTISVGHCNPRVISRSGKGGADHSGGVEEVIFHKQRHGGE